MIHPTLGFSNYKDLEIHPVPSCKILHNEILKTSSRMGNLQSAFV
jgi:hypothetical protein